jgi:UDP-glucuronate 4-epimerase
LPTADPGSSPIIVTGAAGFIGSHVAGALIARGSRVVGVDNLDPFYDASIKRRNLDAVAAIRPGSFEHVSADIRDQQAMNSLFARVKPAGVIHLAAKAGVRPSIADPAGYMLTNVVGTVNILEAARAVDCRRVIAASSSSVYGNLAAVPFSETADVSSPISPYAASKRAMELACVAHHHLHRTPIACLRFFTVFGPRQRPDLAISLFLSRISQGQPIALFGDGTTSRDYTYIDDIVQGVLGAYDRVESLARDRVRIWNLGGNKPHSLLDLVKTIEQAVGTPAILDRKPMQPGDVERTFADLAKSRRDLDYEPRTSLATGVRLQWDWLRAQ